VLPPGLADAQRAIKWAEHIVFFFPLWLGDMPALLKGFLEQVVRLGFAFLGEAKNPLTANGLTGQSARVVVTMGMRRRFIAGTFAPAFSHAGGEFDRFVNGSA